MLKFVNRFLEKSANFLFGDYIKRQEDSYESIMTALEKKKPEFPPDEVHKVTSEQVRKVKKEFFSKALQGGVASVYLDPKFTGVVVPDRFRGSPTLVLNYSYRYHIADFDFDDLRIVASLSFNGIPFQCTVPWDAVLGIGNQGESTFYSFVPDLPQAEDKKTLQSSENKSPEFDQASHDRALENRKKFQVLKGGKE